MCQCFERPQTAKERLKISEYLYFEMSSLRSSKPYPCKQLRLRSQGADGGQWFQKFRCGQLKLASQKQVFLTLLLKRQNSSYGEIKWWAHGAGRHSHSIQSQFHYDRNLGFEVGCLSRLGHHQFAPSGDVILVSFHSDTILSRECRGLKYCGASKGWS